MYLKYGGLCFLNNDIKERFDVVKHNLDFIVSHEYKVDIWKNDLLLQKTPNSNIFDKFILKRILETKETSLIYYRPKKNEYKCAQRNSKRTSERHKRRKTVLSSKKSFLKT